jgi:hypothetical protein
MDIASGTHRKTAMGVFLLVELLVGCCSCGLPVAGYEKEPNHHDTIKK